MPHQFSTSYVEDSITLFAYYKKLGERAMEQVSDEQLFVALDAESNSIAVIVQHLSGNMRSRWTNFLRSDGEKPDRNRDAEFEPLLKSRADVISAWGSGWGILFAALKELTDADLSRTVTIRSEPHSVMQAINRQIAHYSHHVGQIVFLAKHLGSAHWETLSVARGKSQEFTQKVQAGEASQR